MKKLPILALLTCVSFFSCKKKKDDQVVDTPKVSQSRLSLRPVFGTENIVLDSVYTMSNGYKIEFLEVKAYFTGIKHQGVLLKDAALFNFRETGTLVFEANQVVSNPTSIQFGLGVPSSINHNDPSTFPSTNPLNIAIANDMHWDWNPGYIFFKIEAKADTLVDGVTNCNHNLVYHVGTDAYFINMGIMNLNWSTVSSTVHEAWLKLDLKNFFESPGDEIDLKTEFTTHSMASQNVLTEKVWLNFIGSISAQ